MIEIRGCEGFDEMEACVQLQIDTWGYDENDITPRKTFMLAQRIGGQVIGAFDVELGKGKPGNEAKALVGFAMSLPGIKVIADGPEPYLHSHMLAVRPSHRNRGIGAQLKWAQRDEALSRGIKHMQWTFDPLVIPNAFLNIHRLGATAGTYLVDFYGVSSSRLQGGLPTDRLLADWELDSPRVEARLERRPAAELCIDERIMVPVPIDRWKTTEADRKRALDVQLVIRQKFQDAFSRGLVVLGFSRDAEGNGIFELGALTQLQSNRASGFSKRESKPL
ncbi:MAG TPA: GNAT family N-acetyltransferase [Terracidiphilus sp.]|nr:GNAT family N-acetyltransferase [Terracidiphilus sp.]